MNERELLEDLIRRYPCLRREKEAILQVFSLLVEVFEQGGKLLIAGNGGSAADAEHIVGELMKSFVKKRPVSDALLQALKEVGKEEGELLASHLEQGLPAIALTGHNGLTTAFINDVDASMAYAQQVLGYGTEGDAFLAISTSGNSNNVKLAAITAKAKGLKVIGLLGKDGGVIKDYCDACIIAPEMETYKIQELHLPIYHALCLMLEEHFFKG